MTESLCSMTGGWRSKTGGWRSMTGGWRSMTGGWQSKTGGWRSMTGDLRSMREGKTQWWAKWRISTFDLDPWGEGHGVQGQICDILRPQLAMNRFLTLWPHRFPHFGYINVWGGGVGGSDIRSMSSIRPICKCRCPPLVKPFSSMYVVHVQYIVLTMSCPVAKRLRIQIQRILTSQEKTNRSTSVKRTLPEYNVVQRYEMYS